MGTKMCRIALEDGTIASGVSFGAEISESVFGEVVFNTSMTGYQEAITDPSYSGQILIMTAPEIGNYGVNCDDHESNKPQIAGFIVKELSRTVSNYRSTSSLDKWLADEGILAVTGVDTRALVRIIRQTGSMRGVMTTDDSISDEQLVTSAKQSPQMAGQDLANCVTCETTTQWTDDLGDWSSYESSSDCKKWKVVALDCGAKSNIYKHLTAVGCEVISMPLTATAAEILTVKPDGLFVSNGPGDPAAVEHTVEMLSEIAGTIPTFGICLGHQMLALSLGAKTWKLKFGHRGSNQPVRDEETGKVEITSQNHGFCVDEQSLLECGCVVTHRHLNDDTVAGFRHGERPIMGVQYHPEGSPGPHDSTYLFLRFIEMMEMHSIGA